MDKRELALAIKKLVEHEVGKAKKSIKKEVRQDVLGEIHTMLQEITEPSGDKYLDGLIEEREMKDNIKQALHRDVSKKREIDEERSIERMRNELKRLQEGAQEETTRAIKQQYEEHFGGGGGQQQQTQAQHADEQHVPQFLQEIKNKDYSAHLKNRKNTLPGQ